VKKIHILPLLVPPQKWFNTLNTNTHKQLKSGCNNWASLDLARIDVVHSHGYMPFDNIYVHYFSGQARDTYVLILAYSSY
jgi:hypothetical protein